MEIMNITNIKDHEKKEIILEDNFLYKFLDSCLADKLTISEFLANSLKPSAWELRVLSKVLNELS